MGKFAAIFALSALLALSACGDIQQQAKVVTSTGKPQMAGVGDTVLDIRLTESLPNVFGKADAFGRTRDAGRVIVRYTGQQGDQAMFIRQNVVIQSNESTMSRSPMVMPTYQTTTTTGNIGTIPVSGTQTTMGTTYIPATPSTSYATQSGQFQIAAPAGSSVLVEGRRINVLRIVEGGIEYSIN